MRSSQTKPICVSLETSENFPLWGSYGYSPQEWCWLMLFLSMRESDPVYSQTPVLAYLPSGLTSRAVFGQPFLLTFSISHCHFLCVFFFFSAWLKHTALTTLIWFDLRLQLMIDSLAISLFDQSITLFRKCSRLKEEIIPDEENSLHTR